MRVRELLIVVICCSCGRSVLVNDIPDGSTSADARVDVDGDVFDSDVDGEVLDGDVPDGDVLDALSDAARDAEPECRDELVLEFSWPSDGHVTVSGTPVVGELGGGGAPELAFLTVDGGEKFALHILNVLDPESVVSIALDRTMSVESRATPAIADVDSDGQNEVIVVGSSWWPGLVTRRKRVIAAFKPDGTRLWRFINPNWSWGTNGAVSVADLDDDGEPEVVLGSTVLRGRDGTLLSQGPLDTSHGIAVLRTQGPTSCLADIDGDGSWEIVAGRSLFEANGSLRWTAPFEDGFCGVGDFLPQPGREVVLISDGYARILSAVDGELLWQRRLASRARGTGRPPTIADFDGDSYAEFALWAYGGSAVYDATCIDCEEDGVMRILPENVFVQGAFDFNLDGRPELLSGFGTLQVFDLTGDSLARPRYSAVGYSSSPPVIADVDGDGEAELISAGLDRREASPRVKVQVWGHAENGWPATPPVWSQGSFEPSQVNDDGSLSGRSDHRMLRGAQAQPRAGAGNCIDW